MSFTFQAEPNSQYDKWDRGDGFDGRAIVYCDAFRFKCYRGGDPGTEFLSRTGEQLNLQNVWESNLEEEMERLMQASEKYTYVAMVVDGDSP